MKCKDCEGPCSDIPTTQHSSEQPTEYIITEKQLDMVERCYIDDCDGGCPTDYCPIDIGKQVRSRPHPAPAHETDLLKQIREFHAAAHKQMCKDDADEEHATFWKGQWLAYNNVAGLVEHMEPDIARKAREQVLGLARDMYGLMMCVEKINTDEFMEYYAERMKGLKEQYESLRSQQEGDP